MKAAILLAVALSAASSMGCGGGGVEYGVRPVHAETVPGVLDAQWFERTVVARDGKLQVVELLYCPSVPSGPTVCRTAIVWERYESRLLPVGPSATAPARK